MSTILVGLIIIAIAVIPTFIFIRLHKQSEKKRHTARLRSFQNAGIKHGLSFTHDEVLKDKMLGLDTNNQKLLQFTFDKKDEIVVNLKDVESCTLYKEYHQFVIGGRNSARGEQVPARLGLKIKSSKIEPALMIDFYNNHSNVIYELSDMEKKAKKWESLISLAMSRNTKQLA